MFFRDLFLGFFLSFVGLVFMGGGVFFCFFRNEVYLFWFGVKLLFGGVSDYLKKKVCI